MSLLCFINFSFAELITQNLGKKDLKSGSRIRFYKLSLTDTETDDVMKVYLQDKTYETEVEFFRSYFIFFKSLLFLALKLNMNLFTIIKETKGITTLYVTSIYYCDEYRKVILYYLRVYWWLVATKLNTQGLGMQVHS